MTRIRALREPVSASSDTGPGYLVLQAAGFSVPIELAWGPAPG